MPTRKARTTKSTRAKAAEATPAAAAPETAPAEVVPEIVVRTPRRGPIRLEGPDEILLPGYLADPLLRIVGREHRFRIPGVFDDTIRYIPTDLPRRGREITRPGTTTVLRNRTNADGDLVSDRVTVPVVRTLTIGGGIVSLAVDRLAEDAPPLEGTWYTYDIGPDKTDVDSDAGDMTYPRSFQTRPEVNGQQTANFQSDMAQHLGELARILEDEAAPDVAPAAGQRSVVVFPEGVRSSIVPKL